MKILITGTTGLAKSLNDTYSIDHTVTAVSRSNGFDIQNITTWGDRFLDHDCVFNCAYDGFAQIDVLEFFYNNWKFDSSKKIITIGSCVITHKRSEPVTGYWAYKLHKQALQQAHDAMLLDAKCNMKIINPGPIDTNMTKHIACVKMNPDNVAETIKGIVENNTIKRIDLWI